MSEIRAKAIEGLSKGDTFSVTRTFSEQDVIDFANISRDNNPVHSEERFTEVKNLDGLICHGLLVASLITEIGGQIGWLASGMKLDFKGPVYIGETIRCILTIAEMDERGRARAEAECLNAQDRIVLKAVLSGIVPGAREQEVLKELLAEELKRRGENPGYPGP